MSNHVPGKPEKNNSSSILRPHEQYSRLNIVTIISASHAPGQMGKRPRNAQLVVLIRITIVRL